MLCLRLRETFIQEKYDFPQYGKWVLYKKKTSIYALPSEF